MRPSDIAQEVRISRNAERLKASARQWQVEPAIARLAQASLATSTGCLREFAEAFSNCIQRSRNRNM